MFARRPHPVAPPNSLAVTRLGTVTADDIRTDSCEGDKAVAQVTGETDCLTLRLTDAARSVSVDGRCQNISDTNVRAARIALQQ